MTLPYSPRYRDQLMLKSDWLSSEQFTHVTQQRIRPRPSAFSASRLMRCWEIRYPPWVKILSFASSGSDDATAASLLARLPIFAAGAAAAPSAATAPSAAPCQCCRSVFLSCSCQNKVKIPPLAWIGRIDQIVSKLWGKIGYACGLK